MEIDLVLNLKKFEIFKLDTEELPAATTPTVFETHLLYSGDLWGEREPLCRRFAGDFD
jgi:hypothetical protein